MYNNNKCIVSTTRSFPFLFSTPIEKKEDDIPGSILHDYADSYRSSYQKIASRYLYLHFVCVCQKSKANVFMISLRDRP